MADLLTKVFGGRAYTSHLYDDIFPDRGSAEMHANWGSPMRKGLAREAKVVLSDRDGEEGQYRVWWLMK
jgi:hypothetical protein